MIAENERLILINKQSRFPYKIRAIRSIKNYISIIQLVFFKIFYNVTWYTSNRRKIQSSINCDVIHPNLSNTIFSFLT